MPDENSCKLCLVDPALEFDLEKSSYKSVNNLLQRLFDCYNIDVSILGESPCLCKNCFEGVLQVSKQLEKWSNAQKVLQKNALDIAVKKEPTSLLWDAIDDADFIAEDETLKSNEFEFLNKKEPKSEDYTFLDEEDLAFFNADVELLEVEEPQTEDVKTHAEEVSAKVYEELFGIEEIQNKYKDSLNWRMTSHQFFSVCLEPDGLAIAIVLFKDKTPQRSIRMLCTCCNQVFPTVSKIRKHSLVSRAHPEYWCRSCGSNFPSTTDLKFHKEYKNHRLVASKMGFRCLKCPKISTRLSNAVRHENTVHDKISYDCKKCSESFHSRESLAKHHQKFKQCAEITTQLSSAIREEKTIHGGKYACKKCSESFRSRASLTKHKWKHRNHVCHYPNCQKKFKLWEPYVSHLNWHKHNGSRCPVPGCKSIMMPGDHIKHLKTHSKNQVTFYEGVEIISPKGALMGTRKA